MEKQNYNFATAISMVIGVVIGSGIFFKADDILIAVNGNVTLGLIGFLIVGLGVVFGALTIAEYANFDQHNLGLIEYSRIVGGRKFAFIVSWIMMTCYFPTLMVVLALLTADYFGMLIGVNSQLYISIATFILLFTNLGLNIKWPKASGNLQLVTTVAKVIPLILIGIIGGLFFTPANDLSIATQKATGGSALTSLVAIAFAFDGWIVATNIAGDLENSKKNLPRALALGSLGIMVIYMLYFYGITRVLSPTQIIALGDEHIQVVANIILGALGSKVILAFVVISVYGGFNGMTLAFIRMPQEMREMKLIHNKMAIPQLTICVTVVISLLWYIVEQLVDYGIIFNNLKTPFDISSLPIVIIYIIYIVLFLGLNKQVKSYRKWKRIYFFIISSLATLSALIVIYGSLGANGLLYIGLSVVVLLLGVPLYNRIP